MSACCQLAFAAALAAQPPPATSSPESQEITVTGERASRTTDETATSVFVVTSEDIEARPVDRAEQILAAIPNVQLGHGSQGPAIRGQDTTGALQALPAFLGGTRPRTTVVIDGRAVTYNEFISGVAPVWDLQRVEVFRSPQTTTQGQNSIAGAIFLYTSDPGFEAEYRARAIAGDFRTRQLSALASGPVSDDVAVRVAGDLRYSRTTSQIADRAEGADPNHDVFGLLRAKLMAKPASLPGTTFQLTYAHQRSQAPQVVQVTKPFRDRRDESGYYGTFRIRVDSLTAAVAHEKADMSVSLLTTVGDTLARRFAFPGLGQARTAGRDWSGEAVVNWFPAGPVELLGGIARRHTALRQRIDLSVISGISHFRDQQNGTGVFGEAVLRFAPRATLTAGLRYQKDRQERIGAFATATGPIDLDYDRSFEAWLPKLSLAYDFSPALKGGVLVQKAYNPGGTTLRFDIGQRNDFEAERLWDWEAFLRARAAGGRLTASLNAFYYDMRNAQRARDIPIRAPNGRFVGFADLFNVPRARSYGLEAEASWHPSRHLTARVGIGLLRTKIIDAGEEYEEFDGKQFDRSPQLTASASVDWRPTGRSRLSAQVRHHSRYWSNPLNSPQARVPAGTIADVRAEYTFGQLSLFGYSRNLFDSYSITWRNASSATLEDPREVGVGLEARF